LHVTIAILGNLKINWYGDIAYIIIYPLQLVSNQLDKYISKSGIFSTEFGMANSVSDCFSRHVVPFYYIKLREVFVLFFDIIVGYIKMSEPEELGLIRNIGEVTGLLISKKSLKLT
jgi:hypothetical protein